MVSLCLIIIIFWLKNQGNRGLGLCRLGGCRRILYFSYFLCGSFGSFIIYFNYYFKLLLLLAMRICSLRHHYCMGYEKTIGLGLYRIDFHCYSSSNIHHIVITIIKTIIYNCSFYIIHLGLQTCCSFISYFTITIIMEIKIEIFYCWHSLYLDVVLWNFCGCMN